MGGRGVALEGEVEIAEQGRHVVAMDRVARQRELGRMAREGARGPIAHRQLDRAAHAFDAADQPAGRVEADIVVGAGIEPAADRHEVGQRDLALAGREHRAQDVAVGQIAARDLIAGGRADRPEAAAVGIEQAAEHRVGIEALEACTSRCCRRG